MKDFTILKTPKLEFASQKPSLKENSIAGEEIKNSRPISQCFQVIFVGIFKYKIW